MGILDIKSLKTIKMPKKISVILPSSKSSARIADVLIPSNLVAL